MLINKKSIISFGLITCILMPKIEFISFPGFAQNVTIRDPFASPVMRRRRDSLKPLL